MKYDENVILNKNIRPHWRRVKTEFWWDHDRNGSSPHSATLHFSVRDEQIYVFFYIRNSTFPSSRIYTRNKSIIKSTMLAYLEHGFVTMIDWRRRGQGVEKPPLPIEPRKKRKRNCISNPSSPNFFFNLCLHSYWKNTTTKILCTSLVEKCNKIKSKFRWFWEQYRNTIKNCLLSGLFFPVDITPTNLSTPSSRCAEINWSWLQKNKTSLVTFLVNI